MKSLDAKLASIHADPAARKDFILADAKDADMAAGLAATGRRSGHRPGRDRWPSTATRCARSSARGWSTSCSCSASTSEVLTIQERLFDESPVTPAVRANDTTDIHIVARRGTTRRRRRGRSARRRSSRSERPRRPERRRAQARLRPGALLDHAQQRHRVRLRHARGVQGLPPRGRAQGLPPLPRGLRPQRPGPQRPEDIGRFINDVIVRTLAGVPQAGRPIFLKIAYHGPKAMEELVAYDPHLVVGHPRRLRRHDLRRVQAARGGQEARGAGGAVRPQDQQQRAPAHLRPLPARDRGRRDRCRRRRAAPITATWPSWGSSRTARCPRTCS